MLRPPRGENRHPFSMQAMNKQMSERDNHIEVVKVRFKRGNRLVFWDLCCTFPRSQISVILGGSGSGKSTLLRMIGCLEKPDHGDIWIDGETEITCMPENQARNFRHRVGMMFQHGALLDSMTVYDNAALPLREHTDKSEAEIRREVHGVFEAVGLREVDRLLPGQLSGGMLKRAALARALIMAPEILLCDEPFSGLDPQTICLVENLLVNINRKFRVTMLITSHHIESTLRIANHVVVLTDGAAVEGTTNEIAASSDPRVQGFFAPSCNQPALHPTTAQIRREQPSAESPA